VAKRPDGSQVDEAELNLLLANALKKELEKMGATVILNRSDDASLTVDERIMYFKEVAADLCIALHQNAIDGYPNISGCQVMYFTPFSQKISQYMYEQTVNSGVYEKTWLEWYLYYVARQTACPVVLMENGYMTNAQDLANMMDENMLIAKAQSMARATAQYFLSIQ
jgi:N-acetylmuramoyl-L-alanine amidase